MTQNVQWDPQQYLGFDSHRLRPAIDLMSRIYLESPKTIVDLGCGTGNITRLLKDRWPDADVTGFDNSEDMLDRARAEHPDITWQTSDLATWKLEQKADLIFSNAAIHWIDDHHTLLPSLWSNLNEGGVMAIQTPRNWRAPSHELINELARKERWRDRLEPAINLEPSHAPDVYYSILSPLVKKLEIWETEYVQVLEGENPVVEYVKGTWLQRFLQRLEGADQSDFENAYREEVLKAYPKQADGKTLFPFRRLFMLATN